ncbi:FIG00606859: hypothetical protein [Desulfovibrio piger]|uniref:Uncharacterized protein n=1 Tax=Desulfovibrio piger TaxID=901 RepID=A0A1K1LGS3_9BACT|nr:FIG00606859: hypothetical protein [Desulfovibrio piger]
MFVAFAPVNPLAAPWQARGLHCLLMPGDLPPELSLCAMPDAVPAAPVRRPQPAAPRAPRPVRPLPSQLHQEDRDRASAAPAQAVRQGCAPAASPAASAPAAPAPEQRRPARPRPAEQAPAAVAAARSWRPLPPHVWPAVWQERLSRTRQGRVVWTYWNLGPDLCEAQAPGKAQRSAFFRRLMQDLAYPAGTSTFWPACLPDPDAMPASPAPAEGEDRPRYQPNADVFWSGVQALHARAVVVMGSVAARALGLPAGVRPLQQLRHRGTLVWVLWDVEFLLDEPQRYAAMLAFVRRALQQISRR